MVKIYGASDDLVEIEGSTYPEDEIDCYNANVRFIFSDGTAIRIGYPKPDAAIWGIKVEQQGTAKQTLALCNNEDADPYSDVFEIDAEIVSHEVFRR